MSTFFICRRNQSHGLRVVLAFLTAVMLLTNLTLLHDVFTGGRLSSAVVDGDAFQAPPPQQQQNQHRQRESKDSANSSHGTTAIIVPDKLPGVFANHSIYLQTVRLTTSFQTSINDVHVDLFAFPGDPTRPHDAGWEPFCSHVPDNLNQTLLGWQQLKDYLTLYCQVDGGKRGVQHKHERHIFKMAFLPMVSADFVQSIGTVIWRGNVTETINKQQLLRYIERQLAETKATPNVTVHIWMRYKLQKQVTRLATFHIPLDTGSLGVGSVHIRNSMVTKSYYQQPPVTAGLCVALHGMEPLPYLRHFVQHHVNVGFGSIVIGMKGPEDGLELKAAQKLLQRFIDQGIVALAHYDSPFICNRRHGTQVDQMQFYQPCLYYHKGLTRYNAAWDIDEFWTPPDVLNVNGKHNNFAYFQLGVNKIIEPMEQNETAVKPSLLINTSSWSTFPESIQRDPLWQESQYARSVSIADTFQAIEKHYEVQGCKFCFHALPSRVVWGTEIVRGKQRTGRIVQDFQVRKVGYDNTWQKSVMNTNVAFMAGIHLPGSCFYESSLNADDVPQHVLEKQFHPLAKIASCNPKRFEHEVYGSIHHLVNLIRLRWPFGKEPGDNVTQADEYMSLFANTVESQLARDEANDNSSG